jgi:hypothetical protein
MSPFSGTPALPFNSGGGLHGHGRIRQYDGSWESEQRYGDPAEGGAQLKADLWAFQLQVNDAVDVLQPRDLFPTDNRQAYRRDRIISCYVGRRS